MNLKEDKASTHMIIFCSGNLVIQKSIKKIRYTWRQIIYSKLYYSCSKHAYCVSSWHAFCLSLKHAYWFLSSKLSLSNNNNLFSTNFRFGFISSFVAKCFFCLFCKSFSALFWTSISNAINNRYRLYMLSILNSKNFCHVSTQIGINKRKKRRIKYKRQMYERSEH